MNRILMLFSISTMIWYTSCQSHEENQHTESKFLVTSPIEMDTVVTKQYVSQIHSIQHIELRALEKGYLEKIYVDEGQFIKKGQLMFQIMPRLYQAELQRSEAEANFAEIEYQNTKRLAESKIVAPNELALAKAKLDKAKAELALSQVHLDFTQVRAPFDGIMDHFHVRLGSLVDEGELLSTLSDNHEMWVYFNVPEAEYLNYQSHLKGDSTIHARLKLANNAIFNYSGVVTAIEADFNNETGNIAFRATFPNPKGLLRHGETGTILVEAPLKKALIIPQKTTFEILEKRYVFVVKDGIVRSKEIKVSHEMANIYVVEKGLTAKDKILLEGLRKVRDDDEIAIDYRDPEEVLSQLDLYAE